MTNDAAQRRNWTFYESIRVNKRPNSDYDLTQMEVLQPSGKKTGNKIGNERISRRIGPEHPFLNVVLYKKVGHR